MVGAGALGNEVIKALGLLGVSRILVVDPDIVEPGNLNRSIFFRQADFANQNKAKAIVESAGVLFPDTSFQAVAAEIADTDISLLTGTEILFSCVDSDLARLEIAYFSTKFGTPVSEGGLGGHKFSQGRATWFPGRNGACYGCILPAQRRRELLTLWQATPHSCRIPASNTDVPSTPTMAAIIGSLQVELGIKQLLSGQADSESVELSFEGNPRLDRIKNHQAAECPFHTVAVETRVQVKENETANSLLLTNRMIRLAHSYVRLDWPICTEARCQGCGTEWAPMVRTGYLQGRGACPNCGSQNFQVLAQVQNLTPDGRWGSVPLANFGIQPGQWISVRVG